MPAATASINAAACGTDTIEAHRRRSPPEPTLVPRLGCGVDGGKQRAHHADAAAGHNVELDTRFVQRAKHAGVVRAGGTGAGQQERGSALR